MANQEHLDILKQGVEVWNEWREENEHVQIDLSSADLYGTNLSSADFSNASLSFANLIFADLHSANLSSANLKDALQPHLWRETRP